MNGFWVVAVPIFFLLLIGFMATALAGEMMARATNNKQRHRAIVDWLIAILPVCLMIAWVLAR